MTEENTETLLNTVVEGAKEKKAENIVSIDFNKMENHICKYFVICDAESNTQVCAIADSIEENTEKKLHQKVWKKEGFTNAEWIILDYAEIVVHVFQKSIREYYNIEDLWADCKLEKY